jgi:hypothetical protein
LAIATSSVKKEIAEMNGMIRMLIVVGLVAVLSIGVAARPVSGPAQAALAAAPADHVAAPAFLDKTRFVLYLGTAYYAFHHFIWKRYKAHELNMHHKFNLVKAGIAGLFAYNRLMAAYHIASTGNSELLHKLVAPLNALTAKAQVMGLKLKSGQLDTSSITDFNSSANSFQQAAKSGGIAFHDQAVPVPGAA